MAIDYRLSHIKSGKGKSYHATFSKSPYRNMVWQQEQAILDNILKKFFKKEEVVLLDFACGTGRILSYLENQTKHAVGVDVSQSMLEVARENNMHSELIEADLTKKDVLGNRKFNLITAFRFFPNAQPELRKEVMELLCMHLNNNGYIVFNNHLNASSSLNKLYRLFKKGYQGMSMNDIKELIDKNGLEIVKVFHLCVFPSCEDRTILPIILLRPIEALLSKLPFLRNLGQNLIFLCRSSRD
jgi:predicted TPR repeat methyltransferase